jgi:GT2 family glycosyltransferase
MPDELVPPVVAVVVSSDPGPWFEACLDSLRVQDYPNLSILVVDAASGEPIAPRVARVVPDAFLRRLEENRGFGPSANVVTTLVEGSTHFLFCHDDVVLDPDAVRRMVEEAFRENAGVVAPKLVSFDDPEFIVQLGLGVDRFAAPVRRVAHLEFDQQQYDETQEVFAAPGACTLVRSDLFVALGGFDPQISMFGEDVDLCWRAHLLGARIIVAPLARVRHREATAARLRPLPEARGLQWRHEVRAVLKNYGSVRRAVITAELMLWSVIEVAYFAARGRRSRVRQVIGAWRWNFSSAQGLKQARAEVQRSRRINDRELSALLTRGSFRVSRFLGPLFEEIAERRRARRVAPVHPFDEARRHPKVTAAVVAAAVVVIFGSRSILFGHLPLVGTFLPLPSATSLLGHYFGGWLDGGVQRPGPASPAFGILGLVGIVFIGAMGVVEKVVIFGSIVAGAIGVARLVRPLGSPIARAAGSICYLFLPLAWNDIARGDLPGLIAFGAMPYLVRGLFSGTGIDPYAPSVVGRRSALRQIVLFGLLLAGAASFVPLLGIVLPAVAVALGLSSLLLGNRREALAVLRAGFGGVVVAFIVCLPWSVTFVQSGVSWSALTGASSSPALSPQLGAVLRLEFGPLGAGVLGLAFLGASLFVLVATDDARFAWAARLWSMVLCSAALTWAGAEGWLGSGMGELRVLAAPFAVGVATLVGLGVASVSSEIRHLHIGWRHFGVVCFAVLSLAGLLPVLGGSLSGRWGLPGAGYDTVLNWIGGSGASSASQRVLWLGDPTVLPLPGWQISPGLAMGISSGGLPDGSRIFLSADPSALRSVSRAIGSAEAGETVRLGSDLAAVGIRYLIVPSTFAPLISGVSSGGAVRPSEIVLDALTVQSDLHELPSEGGALIFENTAWRPNGARTLGGGLPAPIRTIAVVAEFLGVAVGLFLLARSRRRLRRHARRSTSSISAPAIGVVGPGDTPALVGVASRGSPDQ